MTNPLTEAREAIAASLEPLGFTVYVGPKQQATTPAAILTPGDPWSEPLTFTSSTVRWTVTLLAGQLDTGASAYDRLEEMVWTSVAKLRADGYGVDSVGAPRTQRYGQADHAACDLAVRVLVTDVAEAPRMEARRHASNGNHR